MLNREPTHTLKNRIQCGFGESFLLKTYSNCQNFGGFTNVWPDFNESGVGPTSEDCLTNFILLQTCRAELNYATYLHRNQLMLLHDSQ